MINVSALAAKRIKNLKEEESRPDQDFLRVEVKKGGCAGLSYKMNFDSALRDGDKFFEQNGEKIAVDKESFMYLVGMTLEYEGGLNGKGFVFNNPNASKACSCGTSFNVKN